MYRIDDATAATSLPVPEAAGTEGYFTEGNPATGTPATKVRASWLNMIQEEIRGVVVAAGLTPGKTSYGQLLTAIQSFQRTRLKANTTFYVNASTGSDSNSGLSSGAAFATIQRAWDVISRNYDLNGFVATVNIANGSYGALNASGGPPNSFYDGAIVFNGNTASPGSVTMTSNNVSGTAFAQGAFFTIQGVTLTSSGGSNSMFAAVGGRIIFNNVIFGSSAQSHIVASGGGSAVATGPYTISGGASNHYSTDTGGLIFVPGQTVTLSGTPSFSTAFALVRWCAVLAVTSTTFTGSASGARYSVIGNGVVTGTGGSATYLPGSVAGSTASGGQYT
ncbi:hypothetical protein [Burkholderia stagnalis]|uniref:hypothetical protein n=1 Tax=Burkholderia stagnalis TaxID=1503054 RepID=UPI00162AA978|nr:hypothetical protein [Burkholderia stagnalis]